MPTVVSSTAGLIAALNTCTGGETIYCRPGNYTSFDYYKTGGAPTATATFASPVTIKASRSDSPPIFAGMYLHTITNLTFRNIKFKYTPASGEPNYTRRFEVLSCTTIKFYDCIFEGGLTVGQADPASNGFASGYGLFVQDTNGLFVDHCQVSVWLFAFIITDSQNVTIQYSEFHSQSSDAMQLSAVTTATIKGNYIHDFIIDPASGAHPDSIQFHTNGKVVPNTNITIQDNIIDQGTGDWTQSIFMGNEAIGSQGAGAEMRYSNVTITNNLIINGHLHGITIDYVDNITVDNNTVLQSSAPYTDVPIVGFPTININDGTSAVISDNVVSTLNGVNQSSGTKTNNIVRQINNSGGANYSAIAASGAYDGSALAALGAGASFVAKPTFPTSPAEIWAITTS